MTEGSARPDRITIEIPPEVTHLTVTFTRPEPEPERLPANSPPPEGDEA